MKSEGAVFFVGEPRVRPLGTKTPKEAIDKIATVVIPFVQRTAKKAPCRQLSATRLLSVPKDALFGSRRAAISSKRASRKVPNLTVGRSPMSVGMSFNGLPEVPSRTTNECLARSRSSSFCAAGRFTSSGREQRRLPSVTERIRPSPRGDKIPCDRRPTPVRPLRTEIDFNQRSGFLMLTSCNVSPPSTVRSGRWS